MAASLVCGMKSLWGCASYRSASLRLRHAYRYVFFLIVIAHLSVFIIDVSNDGSFAFRVIHCSGRVRFEHSRK